MRVPQPSYLMQGSYRYFSKIPPVQKPCQTNQLVDSSEAAAIEGAKAFIKEAKKIVDELTDMAQFNSKVMAADRPVILDCYADWCAPCRKIKPLLEKAAQDNEHTKILWVMNFDERNFQNTFSRSHRPNDTSQFQIFMTWDDSYSLYREFRFRGIIRNGDTCLDQTSDQELAHRLNLSVPRVLLPYQQACVCNEGKFYLVKLNIDTLPQLATALHVKSVPSVFLIHRGNVVDTFTGIPSQPRLKEFIDTALLLESMGHDERVINTLMEKAGEFVSNQEWEPAGMMRRKFSR